MKQSFITNIHLITSKMALDISGTFIETFLLQNAQKKLEVQKQSQLINDSGKIIKNIVKSNKNKKRTCSKEPLKKHFHGHVTYEAGIDEAGRGPMFGRVYSACVILPHDDPEFRYDLLKDSKRFTSKNKLLEVYNYIKENAIDYSVCFEDEETIDQINILQATQKCMHNSIRSLKHRPEHLLVDGNYFNVYRDVKGVIPFTCIESGDNSYCSIAAASILAKVERDTYIEEMCASYPELDIHYGLRKNKGYGTKQHIEGIQKYGISDWHRKSFGICKQYAEN